MGSLSNPTLISCLWNWKIFENHLKHFPGTSRSCKKTFSVDTIGPFLLRPRRISGTRLFLKDYKECLDMAGCVWKSQSRLRPGNRQSWWCRRQWSPCCWLRVFPFSKAQWWKSIHTHPDSSRNGDGPLTCKENPPSFVSWRKTLWSAEAVRWKNSWRF